MRYNLCGDERVWILEINFPDHCVWILAANGRWWRLRIEWGRQRLGSRGRRERRDLEDVCRRCGRTLARLRRARKHVYPHICVNAEARCMTFVFSRECIQKRRGMWYGVGRARVEANCGYGLAFVRRCCVLCQGILAGIRLSLTQC